MSNNFLRGTNPTAFIADLALLATVVGIPILIAKKLIKR
jgi:hypothetical protein